MRAVQEGEVNCSSIPWVEFVGRKWKQALMAISWGLRSFSSFTFKPHCEQMQRRWLKTCCKSSVLILSLSFMPQASNIIGKSGASKELRRPEFLRYLMDIYWQRTFGKHMLVQEIHMLEVFNSHKGYEKFQPRWRWNWRLVL